MKENKQQTNCTPTDIWSIWFAHVVFRLPLSDLRGSFKIALWPKGFFVQLSKTGTLTWDQLVARFFPLNELQFESLPNGVQCTVF